MEDISVGGVRATPLVPLPETFDRSTAMLVVRSQVTGTQLGSVPVRVNSTSAGDDGLCLGLGFAADTSHYPMIAELMLADMDVVRQLRSKRRRSRTILGGTLSFLTWSVAYPLRAIHHLVFDRDDPKAADAMSLGVDKVAPVGLSKS